MIEGGGVRQWLAGGGERWYAGGVKGKEETESCGDSTHGKI